MTNIPLFIVEEHHEAFFIWNYAGFKGLIPTTGNTLLHVDQHADMGLPRFHTSLKTLPAQLSALAQFTYNQLCIGNFIPAAIYQGWFKEFYWLQHNKIKISQTLHVYSYHETGQTLLMTTNLHQAGVFTSDRKSVLYELKTVNDPLPNKDGVVLDIDLDYFSCDKQYQTGNLGHTRIEISKEEYDQFITDRYHPLRINVGGVTTHVEQGRYYLLVNAFSEVIPSTLKVMPTQILERIEQFGKFLQDNHIRPLLIDLCRSQFSGFTPADQREFIEKHLLALLTGLYPCETSYIGDILDKEKLTV
ncbi:MAG: UPF0489 family protein [Anaerolineae bacterium]|nr:UPF0489 family protein [Anaerolineae bacterium]